MPQISKYKNTQPQTLDFEFQVSILSGFVFPLTHPFTCYSDAQNFVSSNNHITFTILISGLISANSTFYLSSYLF